MRFTSRLHAQHLGWSFKKHWQTQGKRIPNDTGAASELEKKEILIKNTGDATAHDKFKTNIGSLTHHQWHDKFCYIYCKETVLLEGLPQAQLLTNTVKIKGLPKSLYELIINLKIPSSVERNAELAVTKSNVYDAEQSSLPRTRNVDRPAYKYPRVYGASQLRSNHILINTFLNECEKLASSEVSGQRRILDEVDYGVTLPKNGYRIQMNVVANKIITCCKTIEPLRGNFDAEMPDLYPTKNTISLSKENGYPSKTKFPINLGSYSHPHTVITFFDKKKLRNIHGTNVSKSQFQSRTLLAGFAVAAARAKQIYGNTNIETLPKPIVIQSIQTDGCSFHFGVFQLNTLRFDEQSKLKNYWFQEDDMDLYEICGCVNGQSRLDGYNKNVFRYLAGFYKNL